MLPDITLYDNYKAPATPTYNKQVVYNYDSIVIVKTRPLLDREVGAEDNLENRPPFTWLAKDYFLNLAGAFDSEKKPFYPFHISKLTRNLLKTSLRYHARLTPHLVQSSLIYCSSCTLTNYPVVSILITAPEGINLITPSTKDGVYLFLNNQFITFDNLIIIEEVTTGYNKEGIATTKLHNILPGVDVEYISVYTLQDRAFDNFATKVSLMIATRLLGFVVSTASIIPPPGYFNSEIITDLFTPRLHHGIPLGEDNLMKYLKS